MAPWRVRAPIVFTTVGRLADDDVLLEVLGDGTPAVSTTREFLHYRPSQMPAAAGHAIGNSNRVKADVLFRYLRDAVLPPLAAAGPLDDRRHRTAVCDRASCWRSLLVPLCRRLAFTLNLVAHPRDDRWHRTSIPMLGGIAIGLAIFAGVASSPASPPSSASS